MNSIEKMARLAQFGRGKTHAQEARDEILPRQLRQGLKDQWKAPANDHSHVYCHIVNEETRQEYFITAWDGLETVSAWTNSGMKNVSLRDIYEGGRSAVHVDRHWDIETTLRQVRDVRPIQEQDHNLLIGRKFYTSLDSVMSIVEHDPYGSKEPEPEYIHRMSDPELDIFRVQEDKTNTKRYIVATSPSVDGYKWAAFEEGTNIPLRMTPVEIVYAINEEKAIEQAILLINTENRRSS